MREMIRKVVRPRGGSVKLQPWEEKYTMPGGQQGKRKKVKRCHYIRRWNESGMCNVFKEEDKVTLDPSLYQVFGPFGSEPEAEYYVNQGLVDSAPEVTK